MKSDSIGAGSARDIWEAALGELQIQVNKANFRTWLQPTTGLSCHDNRFTVGVPNTFVAEYLERNQRSLIERTLTSLTNREITVQFQVAATRQNNTTGSSERKKPVPATQIELPGFNSKYTFDTFVEGNGNRLARAAALAVAENPGKSFNPLFIYSGAGLGKTHLLHAIGHVAQTRQFQVLYSSAEQFTNEFVHAIRQGSTEDFHHKFRSVDILLIDDIHFISGKEQTEESFFHTFNELHNANHQIVITSDSPPKSITGLENRLRSRFEWGLTVDIQSPDWETRLAILQAKTRNMGVEIASDVLSYIAQRGTRNIRELEGSLNRLVAYSRLVRSAPTMGIAVQALADIASRPTAKASFTPSQVIEAVASSFKLTPGDLKGRKRDKMTALARQVAMYIIRQDTSYSLKQIGGELGGRDHSTVIHACDKIASSIDTSPNLKRKIQDIKQAISTDGPKSAVN